MSGCCGGGKCGGEERRREELSVSPAVVNAAVKNLFAVAATGIRNMPWPTDEFSQLAALIADMVVENERLRQLLGLQKADQPTVSLTSTSVVFTFGQGNAYTLQIPVQDAAQRQAMIDNLLSIVAALKRVPETAPSLPGQLPLPFNK